MIEITWLLWQLGIVFGLSLLLLVGGLYGFQTLWPTFHSGVLAVLRRECRRPPASFLCRLPDDGPPAPRPVRDALGIVHEEALDLTRSPGQKGYHLQYPRLESCYQSALGWAEARGRRFSHFIRARPDQLWYKPMPPLSSLEPGAISLRARLVMADITFGGDYMAWFGVCHSRIGNCAPGAPRDLRCLMPDDQVGASAVGSGRGTK